MRRPTLSLAELKVVELAAKGLTSTQVGRALYLSPHTIKAHYVRIGRRLGGSGVAFIVGECYRRRLLPVDYDINPPKTSAEIEGFAREPSIRYDAVRVRGRNVDQQALDKRSVQAVHDAGFTYPRTDQEWVDHPEAIMDVLGGISRRGDQ